MSVFWIFLIVISALLTGFVIIARKGRELRRNQPLPPAAVEAFLEAVDGKHYPITTEAPFYVGNSASNDIVIPGAGQAYEICIFYHRKRFAFQTPAKIARVRVNGEVQLAGYLFDGDELMVAGEKFVFKAK